MVKKEKIESKESNIDEIDVILQKGVDFNVTVVRKNLLQRLHIIPSEKKFIIYPIVYGTLLKISKLLKEIDSKSLENLKAKDNIILKGIDSIIENKDRIMKIIAYAIENRDREPPKRLVKFLNRNLTAKEGLQILILVTKQMGIDFFFASIISLKGINPLGKMKSTTGS